MSAKIVIAEYDTDWPLHFERISTIVTAGLGTMTAVIEHVGSTSVPGLAAKPILDIDVAVATDGDIATGLRLLAGLGYDHQGDLGITGREAFSTPPGTYPHHLYLVTVAGREFARHLAFRDRLRRDKNAATEYEQLKLRLAKQFAANRDRYSKAKTEFIEGILREELGTGGVNY